MAYIISAFKTGNDNYVNELKYLFRIKSIVEHGEVIEDYPADQRGHSCLMLGYGINSRPIHAVCSPKDDYLAIITAYLPDKAQWEDDFKTRRKL